MKIDEMNAALLRLASEMTSSMATANMCMSDMDCDEDELYEISQHLKVLASKSEGERIYTGTGSDYFDCVLGVGGFEQYGPITGDMRSE